MIGEAPRLIIADDSADMRWLVRSTLRGEFSDIVEVADGRNLFAWLLRARLARMEPNLVLVVDVRMPVYTGLEVLGAWCDGRVEAPVVVITAFPDRAIRREVARLGALLLPKPFTRAALRGSVAAATQRTGAIA